MPPLGKDFTRALIGYPATSQAKHDKPASLMPDFLIYFSKCLIISYWTTYFINDTYIVGTACKISSLLGLIFYIGLSIFYLEDFLFL